MANGRAPPGPREFLRSVGRFERFSSGLVHLDPCSLADLRRTVRTFASELERHLSPAPATVVEPPAPSLARRLEAEHERFRSSVEQLRGLLTVVEGDDHGGHRQALGQYGRILAEALRRHLADELPREGPPAAPDRR